MSKEVSGTKEWSNSSVNCMTSCSNRCIYCYAKAQAIRFGRETSESWGVEEKAREAAVTKRYGKRKGTVMFPTAHDITPTNLLHTLKVLRKLVEVGNQVLVVSKPHPSCISKICRELDAFKSQVLFRFTIGSMHVSTLKLWEPYAPTFAERLFSLMLAYQRGWHTSVSMEPLLDARKRDIVNLVDTVAPYVTDSIWLGKLNKPNARLSFNFGGEIPATVKAALQELIDAQKDSNIKDLYAALQSYPKVKWKESIKKVVGIEIPTEAGLDI